jgi:hypothetical protein
VCNVAKFTHDKIETLSTGLHYQTRAEAASQLTRLSLLQDKHIHVFLETLAVKPHLDLSVTQKTFSSTVQIFFLISISSTLQLVAQNFSNLEKSE